RPRGLCQPPAAARPRPRDRRQHRSAHWPQARALRVARSRRAAGALIERRCACCFYAARPLDDGPQERPPKDRLRQEEACVAAPDEPHGARWRVRSQDWHEDAQALGHGQALHWHQRPSL
ncbi:hypothetical protein GGF42_005754, partial [Coemansia sp. RSA 2424]